MKSKQKLCHQIPLPILEAMVELDAHVEAAYQCALRDGTPEPLNPDPPLSISGKIHVLEAYSDRIPTNMREQLRACCVMTREVLVTYDQFVSRYSPVAVSQPPPTAMIEVTGWLAALNTAWRLMRRGNRSSGGVSMRIWSDSPPVFLV